MVEESVENVKEVFESAKEALGSVKESVVMPKADMVLKKEQRGQYYYLYLAAAMGGLVLSALWWKW